MTSIRAHALALALLLVAVVPAFADAPGAQTAQALEALTECAGAIVRDDRGAAESALERAETAAGNARTLLDDADILSLLGRGKRTTQRKADRVVERTEAIGALMADSASTRLDILRAVERASRGANRLLHRLSQRTLQCPALLVRPTSGDAVRRGGGRIRLRAIPSDGGALTGATLSLEETLPVGAQVVDGALEQTGSGRYRVRLGTDPGAVRIQAEACGVTTSLWLVVRGPKKTLADALSPLAAPNAPIYRDATPSFRVGEAAAVAAPTGNGSTPLSFSVVPDLPPGLTLDPATGAISGAPTTAQTAASYVVTATNAAGGTGSTLSIDVTPALPDGVDALEAGFTIEPVLSGLSVPVKLAFAPDGRLFFTELTTGNVRVVSAQGELREDPFFTVSILTGGERGLLGIALAPDFDTSGHVFVYASVPAGGGHADRNQVLRLTAVGDAGTDPTPIIDDLPVGILHNAGDLTFGPDGNLYVSIGDADDPALAQQDGSAAGRVLRFAPDGSVPADNPIQGDPEWCRGLRNPFGLAFHARTGGLFVTENGPTANDELLFAQAEKNFEWGPVPPDLPEFLRGLTLTSWTPVIVPTGITFVAETAFGGEFADDLFLCSYDHAEIRRVRLSGQLLTDIDEEVPFLRFSAPEEIPNKPLDATEGPDGALYVSTFDGIWRVRLWSQ